MRSSIFDFWTVSLSPKEEHLASRVNAQKAHDMVMLSLMDEHDLNHVVVAEINVVQRQHHKAMEQLHANHDELSISNAGTFHNWKIEKSERERASRNGAL